MEAVTTAISAVLRGQWKKKQQPPKKWWEGSAKLTTARRQASVPSRSKCAEGKASL